MKCDNLEFIYNNTSIKDKIFAWYKYCDEITRIILSYDIPDITVNSMYLTGSKSIVIETSYTQELLDKLSQDILSFKKISVLNNKIEIFSDELVDFLIK